MKEFKKTDNMSIGEASKSKYVEGIKKLTKC